MEVNHYLMATLAKSRARVVLKDGRTGNLVYWPLPAGRKKPTGRSRHGAKPVIALGTGAHLSVNIEDIDHIWNKEDGETITWN